MKIEKKISFIVAGIEFQNLKTAQFFARYIDNSRKACDDQNKPELSARIILDTWAAATHEECENEELVEIVIGLQMPKPARKKKETKFEMIPLDNNPVNGVK